jgi:hypothetical protein
MTRDAFARLLADASASLARFPAVLATSFACAATVREPSRREMH